MNDMKTVFDVIKGERVFQDGLQKSGKYETAVHTVGEEVLMVCHYADLAKKAWVENFGDQEALKVIRKIAALCVRCMENHGAIPR